MYVNHPSLTLCSTGIHHKKRESARVGMWSSYENIHRNRLLVLKTNHLHESITLLDDKSMMTNHESCPESGDVLMIE